MEKIHVWVDNAEESVKAQEFLHLLGYTPIFRDSVRPIHDTEYHYIRTESDGRICWGRSQGRLEKCGKGSKEVTLDELENMVKEKDVNNETPFEKLCTAVGRINKEAEQYLRTDARELARFSNTGNLMGVMPFSMTPQGYEYWKSIYDALQDSKTKERLAQQDTPNIVTIEDITSPDQKIEVVINGVKSVVYVGDLIVAWGLLGKSNGKYGYNLYDRIDEYLTGGGGLYDEWDFQSIEFDKAQQELIKLYFNHNEDTKEQLAIKKTIQDLESQLELWKSKLK